MGMRSEIRDAAFNIMPKEPPKQVGILPGKGRPQGRPSTFEMSVHGTEHVSMKVFELLLTGLSGHTQSSRGELFDLHGGVGLLGVQRPPCVVE